MFWIFAAKIQTSPYPLMPLIAQAATTCDAILIADSVFAFRREFNKCREYRIWLDVDPETARRRRIARTPPLRVPRKRPAASRPLPRGGDDLPRRSRPAVPGRCHH